MCCAEKGIFRFNVTAHGAAGHASLPRTGDNALLKLAPVLAALASPPDGYAVTEGPAALLRGLGRTRPIRAPRLSGWPPPIRVCAR